MKIKIQVGLAVLVILGVTYWAFATVRIYRYSGSNIMFPVGSGHVVITNTGSEEIPIEMRSEGRAMTFRVTSTDLGLAESSKRLGSGRDAYYAVTLDLPPGEARIDVTRGSGVSLISRSPTRIEAQVRPVTASSARNIVLVATVIVLGALYYISRKTQHRWMTAVRGGPAKRLLQPDESGA